jgi:hypothetical protein
MRVPVSAWLRTRLLATAAVSTVLVINTVIAATQVGAAAGIRGTQGHDVSIPQCSRALPEPGRFAVIGVTGGVAFTGNPCLSAEFSWAAARSGVRPHLYMNLGDPGPQSPRWRQAGPRACRAADRMCLAQNYGANAALDALARAGTLGVHSRRWWLDIEVANTWAGDAAQNVAVIQSAAAVLRHRGAIVGVYSAPRQWAAITGGWRTPMPNWVGGAANPAQAAAWCGGGSFSGGPVQLVQFPDGGLDGDLGC